MKRWLIARGPACGWLAHGGLGRQCNGCKAVSIAPAENPVGTHAAARPRTHHVGANKPAETRKAEPPFDKPGVATGADAATDRIAAAGRRTRSGRPNDREDAAGLGGATRLGVKSARNSSSEQGRQARGNSERWWHPLMRRSQCDRRPIAWHGPSRPASRHSLLRRPSQSPARTAHGGEEGQAPPKRATPTTTSQFEVAQAVGKVEPVHAKPPLEADTVRSCGAARAGRRNPVETTQSITTAPVKPTQPGKRRRPCRWPSWGHRT